MSDNRLYVHILLDRSGSMEACRDTTIKAFNDYIAKLKDAWRTPARVSLTLFDSESIDLVRVAVPAASMPLLSRETFVPRGSTPLLDAIGRTVAAVDKADLAADERVALVILTDGQENASREHSRESVRKLLAGRQEDKGWLVLFLGANQDAFHEARSVGIDAAYAMSYDVGKEAQSLSGVDASIRRYMAAPSAKAGRLRAEFSQEERAAASSSSERKPAGKR